MDREQGGASGGSLVVRWMCERGIDVFFEVPGETFLSILDALYEEKRVRVAVMRHEGGASFAAEAFAKFAGRPALCMATRGPGASNLSIGVQTAHYDGTPLIALTGLIPRSMQGGRAFQEFDPTSMFSSISKRVFVVNSPEALLPTLDQALDIATSGRPGPVVIGLPTDILSGTVPGDIARRDVITPEWGGGDVQWLADALDAARSPAILVATSAERGAAASAIAQLSLEANLPVFCAWRRFSAFDNGHPNFVGSIGIGQRSNVNDALAKADFVLSFGFAIEQITCQNAQLDRAGRRIIQIAAGVDEDARRQVPSADLLQVIDNPTRVANALRSHYEARAKHTSTSPTAMEKPSAADESPRGVEDGELRMDVLMATLDRKLPQNAIVTCDAGNFAQWRVRHVSFGGSRVFLGALDGAMGYGLPAAIGAELAAPGRSCFVFAGDGGSLMSSPDLESAVRLDLSTVVFVFDNHLFGTIRAKQEDQYPGRPMGTELGPVDFGQLARASGWKSWTVRSSEEIAPAIDEVLSEDGCRLVHFVLGQLPLKPAN
jgi:acetolactate synthase-1/2/3 large subunit